jgi:hypothetical protein
MRQVGTTDVVIENRNREMKAETEHSRVSIRGSLDLPLRSVIFQNSLP